MWLFADSGSTKTEWCLVDPQGRFEVSFVTGGLNPYFLSRHEISKVFRDEVLEKVHNVEKVFFYGAGCGVLDKALKVKQALGQTLPASCPVHVAGDILAAAHSSLQDQPGISCILGTGASSCVYNGVTIDESVPSLGFILSDWGSGTVICKDFIAMLLQDKLPAYITEDFFDTYQLTKIQVLDKIYNQPQVNRFLASFSPFVLKHAEEFPVKEIITQNFNAFFAYYVLRYPQFRPGSTVSIVGSIAHYYRRFLLEVAKGLVISIQTIQKSPMEGLIKFHCSANALQCIA